MIDRVDVDVEDADGTFRTVSTLGAVGYRRIAELPRQRTRAVRIRIVEARGTVHLTRLSLLRPSTLLATGSGPRLA